MGVVSGLVMAYQFGTNWGNFSSFAGSITGPLLMYEVLTAFFLEAGFLGVMLFGWNKVGPGLHLFSTVMVALGTIISATWILASNSWMQTPQGFMISNNQIVPISWLEIIFNPSFPYRLAHMIVAAYLATAVMVAASGAWHLLKKQDSLAVKTMFSMALWMITITAPIQIFLGDQHGLNTLKHQPAKLAAIEGHWQNKPNTSVPLILFAIPDMAEEKNKFELAVPYLGSLILTHSIHGQVPALKDFPPQDRPNVAIVFWTFRIMVSLGILILCLGLMSLWLRIKKIIYQSKPFLKFALYMGPSGIIAILAGWFTTEIGRQPWIIYGLMRTKDAVSNHSTLTISLSLLIFIVIYCIVFGTGISYLIKLIAKGPKSLNIYEKDEDALHRPARPLSAAPDNIDPMGIKNE
jgi:cytochrome bd ubiquinol oxidase subunit I